MAKITGKDTKPEVLVRKHLFLQGFRYRKNDKRLPGKPDIVLSKYKTVIFVHGCFWHHHKGCRKSKLPETAKEFWETKIHGNLSRDKENYLRLQATGWRVIVIWQCEISSRERRERKLAEVVDLLRS